MPWTRWSSRRGEQRGFAIADLGLQIADRGGGEGSRPVHYYAIRNACACSWECLLFQVQLGARAF